MQIESESACNRVRELLRATLFDASVMKYIMHRMGCQATYPPPGTVSDGRSAPRAHLNAPLQGCPRTSPLRAEREPADAVKRVAGENMQDMQQQYDPHSRRYIAHRCKLGRRDSGSGVAPLSSLKRPNQPFSSGITTSACSYSSHHCTGLGRQS